MSTEKGTGNGRSILKEPPIPNSKETLIMASEQVFLNSIKKGFYEHPSAIMDFGNGQDSVSVTYYTQTGKPISQGKMIDRLREGKWTYFHQMNDSVMMIEHYKNDKLNGFQETFYPDGKLAEKNPLCHGRHGWQQPDLCKKMARF